MSRRFDGFDQHSSPAAMQKDHDKQNALVKIGWEVPRFTWSDVVDRPGYVIRQVSMGLERRVAA